MAIELIIIELCICSILMLPQGVAHTGVHMFGHMTLGEPNWSHAYGRELCGWEENRRFHKCQHLLVNESHRLTHSFSLKICRLSGQSL